MPQLYRTLNFNGLIVESLGSRLVELCDENGLMVMLRHVFPALVRSGEYLPGVADSGYPFQIYLSGKYAAARREFEEKIARIVRKFRNSPSIVIWGINPPPVFDDDWICWRNWPGAKRSRGTLASPERGSSVSRSAISVPPGGSRRLLLQKSKIFHFSSD